MNALDIYKAQYEEELSWYDDEPDKYHWAAGRIFNLTTYDGELDELFVKNIIEVCKVILEKRSFEYIKDRDNYIKYIIVCQILKDFNWIDWGTSIRGAWFYKHLTPSCSSRDILEELSWSEWNPETKKHDICKIDKVPFSVENIRALIEFMEE